MYLTLVAYFIIQFAIVNLKLEKTLCFKLKLYGKLDKIQDNGNILKFFLLVF